MFRVVGSGVMPQDVYAFKSDFIKKKLINKIREPNLNYAFFIEEREFLKFI